MSRIVLTVSLLATACDHRPPAAPVNTVTHPASASAGIAAPPAPSAPTPPVPSEASGEQVRDYVAAIARDVISAARSAFDAREVCLSDENPAARASAAGFAACVHQHVGLQRARIERLAAVSAPADLAPRHSELLALARRHLAALENVDALLARHAATLDRQRGHSTWVEFWEVEQSEHESPEATAIDAAFDAAGPLHETYDPWEREMDAICNARLRCLERGAQVSCGFARVHSVVLGRGGATTLATAGPDSPPPMQ